MSGWLQVLRKATKKGASGATDKCTPMLGATGIESYFLLRSSNSFR
jgi:hypothetical protein